MNDSPPILWTPSSSFKSDSHLQVFIDWLSEKYALEFDNYDDLWQWSVENTAEFWECLWHYFDIKSYSPYSSVISNLDMPGTQWFTGASLSYAEHIFRNSSPELDALIFINEQECSRVPWAQLEQKVASFQAFLKSKGIGQGDRVAAYLPNIPEAIIAFLAVNSLGAIWSCCSPDFGADTVIERFSQINPKLLIACDGYRYNGKPYDKTDEVKEITDKLESVQSLVLVPYLGLNEIKRDHSLFADVLKDYASDSKPEFVPVDFNHPIWVLYSSGTTGKPKAITHSHGGMLLEHLKYMHFHNDVKRGENFFWFTTTGWMMWNFLQASMLAGATPIIYDGSPGYPDLEILWQYTQDLPIHHFGTSAPYLIACMKKQLPIKDKYDLSNLRSIGSTGAPLPEEAFEWIYKNISDQVWLCSMSGGTDVCTAFVGGNPLKPVSVGRIQSRALGCALYAYDENGNKVESSLGEMVIEKPMPCMPVYFWGDDNNQRYQSSYFSKFNGKWCHGDWIKLYKDGSLIIQGRSDATLNRKGIRIGTAEIYSALDKIRGLSDSLIINIEKKDGSDFMPLFVMLNKDEELSERLIEEIKTVLRTQCSPRHIPDQVFQVDDIPYTLSGKKMEVPVKKLFMGFDISTVLNKDAMRNPESIKQFIQLKDQITGQG